MAKARDTSTGSSAAEGGPAPAPAPPRARKAAAAKSPSKPAPGKRAPASRGGGARRKAQASAQASAPASAQAPFEADALPDGGPDDAAPGSGRGKQLVIVESPAKAKTINKYLGPGFVVLPSVGHVRDLPSKNKKGQKWPVPGVDLENDFAPQYEVLEGKGKVIGDLKRTARTASAIWFATDPDREGEAIAWHLAEELGVKPEQAKRVMFAEITKGEIQRAFSNPHPIHIDRVNAQQARRILDRIVGYQVSPLLWKKVARGLSAGRVQSVAVRLIVEREREIRAFVPDERWEISAIFTAAVARAGSLRGELSKLLATRDAKGQGPGVKAVTQWLESASAVRAELIEVGGEKFELTLSAQQAGADPRAKGDALAARAAEVAALAGLRSVKAAVREDASGKGSARFLRSISGEVDPATPYKVQSIDTKRTTSRPPPPFITSTLQQAGSNRLGMSARRTMAAAQQLYQGVDIPGEGPVALITYMRTDSTNISAEAMGMVRDHIGRVYGQRYLPEKPNVYTSSNKDAQEAHEAVRPTNVAYTPDRLRSVLKPDLFRVYEMIWERFVACQMTPAQWDATSVTIRGGSDPRRQLAFRAGGRVLVFDGFYRVAGVPSSADEQTLPPLAPDQPLAPLDVRPEQKFSAPPPRYTEASLIKTLESEGIGRPSTYASIIGVIQDRKYVEQLERRFWATDLGMAVTDKLIEAFPDLMDVGYTRDMEALLDKIEEDHLDWVQMLRDFYGPFSKRLGQVESTLTHAKAVTTPAPYPCATCGSPTVYRLGKNGRFLSCSTYPTCNYACPVDRDGKPQPVARTQVACPKCGSAMSRRVGRFGPFLGCTRYGDKKDPCDGILNLDKQGRVVAPTPPPFLPQPALPCPKCQSAMYLRPGKYGPWLGCSKFPKCRGRGDYKSLTDAAKAELAKAMQAHQLANPAPVIKTLDGQPLTGADGKPLPAAKPIGEDGQPAGDEPTMEQAADELGL